MYLLDTNVISELRRAKSGRATASVVDWARRIPASSMFLCAISILELEIGVLSVERRDRSQGRSLRRWLEEQVLRAFSDRILPIDSAIAIRCAALHVPNPHSERDALIAAAALIHGMTVATRNTVDFRSTGVLLVNPWQRNSTQ
jgi:predicted nucleic acid-binding protein